MCGADRGCLLRRPWSRWLWCWLPCSRVAVNCCAVAVLRCCGRAELPCCELRPVLDIAFRTGSGGPAGARCGAVRSRPRRRLPHRIGGPAGARRVDRAALVGPGLPRRWGSPSRRARGRCASAGSGGRLRSGRFGGSTTGGPAADSPSGRGRGKALRLPQVSGNGLVRCNPLVTIFRDPRLVRWDHPWDHPRRAGGRLVIVVVDPPKRSLNRHDLSLTPVRERSARTTSAHRGRRRPGPGRRRRRSPGRCCRKPRRRP